MTTEPEAPQPQDDQVEPPRGEPAPPPYGTGQPPMRPDEEKLWAIGAHLGGLVLGFLAPLVVWLVFRERSAFLNRSAKEALNFQMTVMIAYLVSAALMIVLVGILMAFAVMVGSIVLMVMAAIAVSRLEDYRYPVTIRFIN